MKNKIKEPSFDKDGYPTKYTLNTITKWPIHNRTSCKELLEFVHKAWYFPSYFDVKGNTYRISTIGWSGNEDIIQALQKNYIFWSLCWQSSRRGGHYVFRITLKK